MGDIAAGYAGGGLRKALSGDASALAGVTEIRARLDRPLIVRASGRDWFITENGGAAQDKKDAYRPTLRDISLSVELISDYSIYAFQDELRNGFITLPGGHPVVSQSHVCRTVCRRAERVTVRVSESYAPPPGAAEYLNRLSDWLYVVGRKAVKILDIKETYWIP